MRIKRHSSTYRISGWHPERLRCMRRVTQKTLSGYLKRTSAVTNKTAVRLNVLYALFLRIAASVAILLICSIGGYYIGRNTPDIVYIEKEAVIMNQAIMGKGSKGSVILPDGSVAWLNTNSKLTYPEKFSDKYRKVKTGRRRLFRSKEERTGTVFSSRPIK